MNSKMENSLKFLFIFQILISNFELLGQSIFFPEEIELFCLRVLLSEENGSSAIKREQSVRVECESADDERQP